MGSCTGARAGALCWRMVWHSMPTRSCLPFVFVLFFRQAVMAFSGPNAGRQQMDLVWHWHASCMLGRQANHGS